MENEPKFARAHIYFTAADMVAKAIASVSPLPSKEIRMGVEFGAFGSPEQESTLDNLQAPPQRVADALKQLYDASFPADEVATWKMAHDVVMSLHTLARRLDDGMECENTPSGKVADPDIIARRDMGKAK